MPSDGEPLRILHVSALNLWATRGGGMPTLCEALLGFGNWSLSSTASTSARPGRPSFIRTYDPEEFLHTIEIPMVLREGGAVRGRRLESAVLAPPGMAGVEPSYRHTGRGAGA